jgi:hypothetical protein
MAAALALKLGVPVNGARQDRPVEDKEADTAASGFYCNTRALSPVERVSHMYLSAKLISARKKTVETETGYEFQFSPADVSLDELARWVRNEARCCPFFDFHIDLEEKGSLLCLRLTGQAGIKAFIRSEFQVATK